MEMVEPTKDTTLDCINVLIEALEQYEQWFDNEKYCKEELQWLKGWSERVKEDLLELKAIKESNPSEVIEKAIRCLNIIEGFMRYHEVSDSYKEELETIKQALQSKLLAESCWEICKKKRVDVYCLLQCKTVDEYNDECFDKADLLTEAEFITLKEGLKKC